MRIDVGLVLGIVLEYIFFIYYADTLFYRKRNKYVCYTIIGAFYLLHLIICIFGNISINAFIFAIANIFSFIICYHINFKSAVFQSVILVILSIASELVIMFIPQSQIIPTNTVMMNSGQSLILTITSKSLYLIGVMLISKLFYKKEQTYGISSLFLVLIPILTIIALFLMIKTDITSGLLSGVCFIFIVINLVLLLVNKKTISKDLEIAELKEETIKENLILDEYLLLKEKYEKINILHHDFKEHMNALTSLINNDNNKAKAYIKSIYNEEVNAQLVEYTDNNMLNILLAKKKEECKIKGIQFDIDPIQAHMTFFNDIDVISLFSNLINNAIEGCAASAEKKIFLNIHTTNENFIVIKLENTADTKPLVIDGKLCTHKDNKSLHGIGMNSIRRSLKKYDGSLKWTYNAIEKIFCTTIIIQHNTKSHTTQAI